MTSPACKHGQTLRRRQQQTPISNKKRQSGANMLSCHLESQPLVPTVTITNLSTHCSKLQPLSPLVNLRMHWRHCWMRTGLQGEEQQQTRHANIAACPKSTRKLGCWHTTPLKKEEQTQQQYTTHTGTFLPPTPPSAAGKCANNSTRCWHPPQGYAQCTLHGSKKGALPVHVTV
jgi:hypothetical protein